MLCICFKIKCVGHYYSKNTSWELLIIKIKGIVKDYILEINSTDLKTIVLFDF